MEKEMLSTAPRSTSKAAGREDLLSICAVGFTDPARTDDILLPRRDAGAVAVESAGDAWRLDIAVRKLTGWEYSLDTLRCAVLCRRPVKAVESAALSLKGGRSVRREAGVRRCSGKPSTPIVSAGSEQSRLACRVQGACVFHGR